jgi:hypothetical protein
MPLVPYRHTVRRKAIVAAAIAAGVLAGAVQASSRESGVSIGDASDVILGEAEYGAPENGARFWRIPLLQRDSLTIDLSNGGLSGRDRPIRFCLLAPGVNDVTLRRSQCVWQTTLRRGAKEQVRFSARSSGRWTLGAVSSTCSTFQSCATGSSTFPFVYEFVAYVRHFTRTRLVGPRTANPRSRIAFTGSVPGATSGNVEIETSPDGGRWTSVATARIKANGSFAWSTRAASKPGRYRVRASYPGDDSHLPSHAIHSYRVVGG